MLHSLTAGGSVRVDPTPAAVVEHHDPYPGPGLTDAEKSDLVEFLETL